MKPPFVSTLTSPQIARLEKDLLRQGFSFSEKPYMRFFSEKKGISCAVYQSGKVVVQGKESPEWISFYFEPEILKSFPFSHPEEESADLSPHIGMDESGKGDLFGPLVIAGVFADQKGIEKLLKMGVQDCKKLSDAKVKALGIEIKKTVPNHTLVLLPKKYNELYEKIGNLNHLLAWGHASVIASLVEKTGCKKALVDRFANPALLLGKVRAKVKDIELTQKTHAESDPIVAAASILAREAFLRHLDALGQNFGIKLPKGAGKETSKALEQFFLSGNKAYLGEIAKLHFKNLRAY